MNTRREEGEGDEEEEKEESSTAADEASAESNFDFEAPPFTSFLLNLCR